MKEGERDPDRAKPGGGIGAPKGSAAEPAREAAFRNDVGADRQQNRGRRKLSRQRGAGRAAHRQHDRVRVGQSSETGQHEDAVRTEIGLAGPDHEGGERDQQRQPQDHPQVEGVGQLSRNGLAVRRLVGHRQRQHAEKKGGACQRQGQKLEQFVPEHDGERSDPQDGGRAGGHRAGGERPGIGLATSRAPGRGDRYRCGRSEAAQRSAEQQSLAGTEHLHRDIGAKADRRHDDGQRPDLRQIDAAEGTDRRPGSQRQDDKRHDQNNQRRAELGPAELPQCAMQELARRQQGCRHHRRRGRDRPIAHDGVDPEDEDDQGYDDSGDAGRLVPAGLVELEDDQRCGKAEVNDADQQRAGNPTCKRWSIRNQPDNPAKQARQTKGAQTSRP